MPKRWWMLAVLFFARFTMAFQFQSVAALSLVLTADRRYGLVDIGLPIGLYLAPGVLVAIIGSVASTWFGEKRIVLLSMGLMLVGAALVAVSESFALSMAGRVIPGIGEVIVNIVMTEMLVDWFVEKEISTALSVFITSWPAGIAGALLVLPQMALSGGLPLARWGIFGIILGALAILASVYHAPKTASIPVLHVTKLPLYSLTLAGLIWAFYNVAFAMVFSFVPTLSVEHGWSLSYTSAATSAFVFAMSLALPLGGILADWNGRRDLLIAVSFISFPAVMLAFQGGNPTVVAILFCGVGAIFALGAGRIVTRRLTFCCPKRAPLA